MPVSVHPCALCHMHARCTRVAGDQPPAAPRSSGGSGVQRRGHMRACQHMSELASPHRCSVWTASVSGVVEAARACTRACARVCAYWRKSADAVRIGRHALPCLTWIWQLLPDWRACVGYQGLAVQCLAGEVGKCCCHVPSVETCERPLRGRCRQEVAAAREEPGAAVQAPHRGAMCSTPH